MENTTQTQSTGATPSATPNLNTYIAFYKGKQIEVKAATSYAAQLEAAKQFKAKKSYDVTVMICERADGSEVIHSTSEI